MKLSEAIRQSWVKRKADLEAKRPPLVPVTYEMIAAAPHRVEGEYLRVKLLQRSRRRAGWIDEHRAIAEVRNVAYAGEFKDTIRTIRNHWRFSGSASPVMPSCIGSTSPMPLFYLVLLLGWLFTVWGISRLLHTTTTKKKQQEKSLRDLGPVSDAWICDLASKR